MRKAGLVVAGTLQMLAEATREAVTPLELDALAEQHIRRAGARPSFLEVPRYRHCLCVSVNDEVVHGIPGDRPLRQGDLVSIDCGAVLDGWHGDAAISLLVGEADQARPEDRALVEVTEEALWAGICAFTVGGHIGDIGAAVEDAVTAAQRRLPSPGDAFGIVTEYEGHGIGRHMHMSPGVANHRSAERGPRIRSGATVAIEPMVTLGSAQTAVLEDGWTVITTTGGRAAHWEHTVATTDAGLCVLTAADGGAARLTALGVPFTALD